MLGCYQNCDQKCTRQDLADKKERNGKQKKKQKFIYALADTQLHTLE